jgi:ABC-type Fe3+-hydroxamate transport system substrate-binding protein
MKVLLAILVAFALSACATSNSQMSADQLKAVAADKNFSAVCSNITGVWGTGKFVYVNVDRSVVANGTIAVDTNCLVTMSNESTAAALKGATIVLPPPVVVSAPPPATVLK